MTLLIVDDETATRDTLQDVFEDEGYTVAVASDGREAMDLLPKLESVCLVILDLVMPRMTGEELVEAMRGDPRFASVPVLVITSDPSRAPAGLTTFRKPLKLDVLIETVGKYCAPRRPPE
jgi:CheY-like chemotaxis protein